MEDQGFVYALAYEGQRDHVKIGYSSKPDARLTQYATSSPLAPVYLACWPGYRATERRIINKFLHLRARGEWFHATPEILDYIAAANDAAAWPGIDLDVMRAKVIALRAEASALEKKLWELDGTAQARNVKLTSYPRTGRLKGRLKDMPSRSAFILKTILEHPQGIDSRKLTSITKTEYPDSPPNSIGATICTLVARGRAVRVGDLLFTPSAAAAIGKSIATPTML